MATITVNFKCNNNCISCINYRKVANSNRERSLDDIKRMMKKLEKEGVKHLDLNGGEPTIKKDLFEILKYLEEEYPRLEVKLLSNGRMFCYADYVEKLRELNLTKFSLVINLYAGDKSINDAITRSPGSWEQTVKGMKNLLHAGFKVELRIVVNKLNYRHLPEMAGFILREFGGIASVDFINMKVTGEARKNRNIILPRYTESVAYVQRAVDILKDQVNVRLLHFPFCILERKYWDFAKGVTIDRHITLAPQCDFCEQKNDCPMIWKSYIDIIGPEEFKPIGMGCGH